MCTNKAHAVVRRLHEWPHFFLAANARHPDGRRRHSKGAGRTGPSQAYPDADCAVPCCWMRMVALLSCDALALALAFSLSFLPLLASFFPFLSPTACANIKLRDVSLGAARGPFCCDVVCVWRARIFAAELCNGCSESRPFFFWPCSHNPGLTQPSVVPI